MKTYYLHRNETHFFYRYEDEVFLCFDELRSIFHNIGNDCVLSVDSIFFEGAVEVTLVRNPILLPRVRIGLHAHSVLPRVMDLWCKDFPGCGTLYVRATCAPTS